MMIAVILLALACSDVTSGASVRDEMCGSSICLVNTTCCNWESGSACCVYANYNHCRVPDKEGTFQNGGRDRSTEAVCCSDGTCCPSGTTCNAESGRCDSQDGGSVTSFENATWVEQQDIIVPPVENVVCPGGVYECPDANTCCETVSGQWGCCPVPQAVCCNDKIHCCPNGYTCASGQCTASADMRLIWLKKTRSFIKL